MEAKKTRKRDTDNPTSTSGIIILLAKKYGYTLSQARLIFQSITWAIKKEIKKGNEHISVDSFMDLIIKPRFRKKEDIDTELEILQQMHEVKDDDDEE